MSLKYLYGDLPAVDADEFDAFLKASHDHDIKRKKCRHWWRVPCDFDAVSVTGCGVCGASASVVS